MILFYQDNIIKYQVIIEHYNIRWQAFLIGSVTKKNDIKHFAHLFPDCKIVVEPFAGSCAVSKYLFKESGPSKQYHINDNDKLLFKIYTHYEEYKNYVILLNKTFNESFGKWKQTEFHKHVKSLDTHDADFKKHFISSYFIRGSIYRSLKSFDFMEPIFMNYAHMSNDDYSIILNTYKDNEDAFLFLDPPYMFQDNSQYETTANVPNSVDCVTDASKILIDILNFMGSAKCKVMLIINDMYVVRHLFGKYVRLTYGKSYSISKRKAQHIVATNY